MRREKTFGVVLAGGKSSRMAGDDKRLLAVAGKSLVQAAAEKLVSVCDRVVVVTDGRDVDLGLPDFITVKGDVTPGLGPMVGILTGLAHFVTDGVIVLACDMPFVPPELVAYVRDVRQGHDIVVPRRDGRLEPLLGFYGPACTPLLRDRVRCRNLSVGCFIRECGLAVRYVEKEEISRFGDPGTILHNVNTPGQLAVARRIARPGQEE